MKSKLLITIFLLTPFLHLAQIKDSTFRNHLIVKFAPLTMFGLNSAVQLGLETNYSKNKSICLDYAFGGNKTGKDFFGLEIEGLGKETSQRLKLEHRWYLHDRYKRYNTSSQNSFLNKIFIGLELAYKNVKYQKEVDLGHGNYTIRNLEVQEFDYEYYELKKIDFDLNSLGFYAKIGRNDFFANQKLYLEYFFGIGFAYKTNTFSAPSQGKIIMDDNEPFELNSDFWEEDFLNFQVPKSYKNYLHPDLLLSLKINYLIF